MANNFYNLLGTGLQNLAQNSLSDMLSMKNIPQSPFATPSIQDIFQQQQQPTASQIISQNSQPVQLEAPKKSTKPKTIGELKIEQEQAKTARNWYQPFYDRKRAADKDITEYKLIKDLALGGKVRSGTRHIILKKLGLEKVGRNAETQIFEKLTGRLAQNAPTAFGKGTRLTNFLEQTFQRSIPNLEQDPASITAIADMNALTDQALILEEQAARDILRENNGVVPFDADAQVAERIAPELKRIEEEILSIGTHALENYNASKKSNKGKKTQIPEGITLDQEESIPGYIGRQLARTGARVGEAALGLPGNIAGGILGLGNYLSGGTIPTYEQVQEKSPIPLPPTSEQIKQKHEPYTGEYLQAQTPGENFADDIISTATEIFLPGPKGLKQLKATPFTTIMKQFGISLGKSALAETGAKTAELFGASPLTQGITKFALLSAPFGGRKALTQKMQDSYKTAEDLVKGKSVDATRLEKNLTKIADVVGKSDKPSKPYILERIKNVDKAISGGKIDAADAWELKKNMNEWLKDKSTPKEAKPYLKKINTHLRESLTDLEKQNPAFKKAFTEAEDIYKGLNKASDISKFLQDKVNVSNLVGNHIVRTGIIGAIIASASHAFSPYSVPALAIAGGTGLGAVGARELFKFGELLKNSKTARKYYTDMFKHAAQKNVKAVTRDIQKLDATANNYF